MKNKIFKVLIVDDEPTILKGLINTYDWEKFGFEIIGSAKDGYEAYDKVRDIKPDVVITDIRMKKLDGLSLIEMIKKEYENIYFVIISAYKDFEYAQKACKLNVFHYLVKPFDDELFSKTMQDLYMYCLTEEKNRNIKLKYSDLIHKNKETIESMYLSDYLNNYIRLNTFIRQLNEISSSLDDISSYCVVSIDIEISEIIFNNSNINIKRIALKDLIVDIFGKSFEMWFFNLDDGRLVVTIKNPENIESLFRFNETKISNILESDIYYSISKTFQGLKGLKKSFDQTIYSNEMGSKNIDNKIEISKDININSYPRKEEMNIIYALRLNDKEPYSQTIKSFIRIIDCYDNIDSKKIAIQKLILNISQFLNDTYGYTKNVKEIIELFIKKLSLIESGKDLRVLHNILIKILEERIELSEKMDDKSVNEHLLKAKGYIDRNISDSDLSVKKISDFVHLNPAYFGRIFKEEMNKTIKEYVFIKRMELAKKLLIESSKSILEISNEVGVKNPSYFSKLFKDYSGILPSKYMICKKREKS